MPAIYNTLYDVRNVYAKPGKKPRNFMWGVYKRDAYTTIIAHFKRKRDAAHMAAILSGPLKYEPPTPG